MKTLLIIVIFLAIIASGAYGAFTYHIIRTDNGIETLRKVRPSLEYTYVDARGARKYKVFLIPELAEAGLRDLLRDQGIVIERQ